MDRISGIISGIKLRNNGDRFVPRGLVFVSTRYPGVCGRFVNGQFGIFGGGNPNLHVRQIRSDCTVVTTSKSGDIQFGSPPEIIKKFMLEKRPIPQTIVLGPTFVKDGFVLNEVEFPLYANFFIYKRKLRIIGTQEQLERARIVLTESLFGPDIVEGKSERDYFKVKDPNGEPLSLADFVDFIAIDGREVEIERVKIVQIERGIFRVIEDGIALGTVDANMFKPEKVPLEIFKKTPFEPPRFGVTFIGTSSGFDPVNRTTSIVLWANGQGIYVDPLEDPVGELNKQGISSKDVPYVLLTHCHADHDVGILRRVLNGERVRLITSRTIYESLLKKAEAMAGIQMRDFIELIEANPGDEIEIEGVKIKISSALHSIPTIRFKTEYTEQTSNGPIIKKIAYSADTFYHPEKLKEMKEKGIISEERLRELLEFVEGGDYDLLVHEAGMPPIHTPAEVLNSLPEETRKKIILVHTGKIPEGINLKIAKQGETMEIVPSKSSELKVLEAIASNAILRELTLGVAMAISRRAKVMDFKLGERIIQQGTTGDNFFLIINGKVKVSSDSKILAFLGRGDYFGEIALLTNKPRTANIDAISDGQALVIEKDTFLKMMEQVPTLAKKLKRIPLIRSLLSQIVFLQDLPADKLALLASQFEQRTYNPGDTLIKQGTKGEYFFVIKEGEVEILVQEKTGRKRLIATRGPAEVLGEISLLKGIPTTATVRARSTTKVLVLTREKFEQLCAEIPSLRFNLIQIGEERFRKIATQSSKP